MKRMMEGSKIVCYQSGESLGTFFLVGLTQMKKKKEDPRTFKV